MVEELANSLTLKMEAICPPKRRFTFIRLHGVIFQKTELFITSAVKKGISKKWLRNNCTESSREDYIISFSDFFPPFSSVRALVPMLVRWHNVMLGVSSDSISCEDGILHYWTVGVYCETILKAVYGLPHVQHSYGDTESELGVTCFGISPRTVE
jgi:hypothetical protein